MELKDRIKQKADELYSRYGIKSVTMDEIASQLGVSKKTIYQCFSDKNELVDAVIVDIINDKEHTCLDSRKNSKDAVHEVFLAMESMQKLFDNLNPAILFDMERNHPVTYQKFSKFKYDFLLHIMKKNIQRGKAEGLYRPEMDEKLIAKVRIESIMLPFNEELFPKTEFSLLYIQEQMMEFFLYGMVTPQGYKLITKYKKEMTDNHRKKINV